MLRTLRILVLIGLAVSATFSADPPKRPKLVVAIIIDQFRYDYLLRFRDDYNSGLARLLQQGAVFRDARYVQLTTVTAVGHSTFLTGATPSVSGIVANEWYDRETGRTVTSVTDTDSKLVGGIAGLPGSSPRRMLVGTVGDELKIRFGKGSKVISVSIKDRSAVLPGGRMANGAFWFDGATGRWVTSDYYMDSLPAWATRLNSAHPAQQYVGRSWFPLDATGPARKALCTMVAGTDVRFCGAVESTPWGNDIIEQFAEAVLAGERLGQRDSTDLLAISFSSNDYVGHAVGPDDPAVRDISIRTDRLLGQLFARLEQSVGAGNYLIALTADHGVAPVPEVNEARRMPGGRISEPLLAKAITDALNSRFGEGDWLLPGSIGMPYFNLKTVERFKLDRAEVEKAAAAAAAAYPHIARVFTRTQLTNGMAQQDSISRAVSLSYYPPRSGDLVIVQEPYYIFDDTGTGHGTPYAYDAHVPLIFLGAGIKAGTYSQPVTINDVAPTLAQILGVARPAGALGRVLSEMLP